MNIVPPLVGHGKGVRVSRDECFDYNQPFSKFPGLHLPHWEQPDKIQFITLRLEDSLPHSTLDDLENFQRKLKNGDISLSALSADYLIKRIDYWLNQGYGACILKYDIVQNVVRDALHYYDGEKMDLFDYVIMPNHIHFLAVPYDSLKVLMRDFRKYTSRIVNKLLGTTGSMWQEDYFDYMVRNVADYYEKAEYIRYNPVNDSDL